MKLKLDSCNRALCPQCGESLLASGTLYFKSMIPRKYPYDQKISAYPRSENFDKAEVDALYCTKCKFRTEQLDDLTFEEFNVWGEEPEYPRVCWYEDVQEGNTNRGYWEWAEDRKRSA